MISSINTESSGLSIFESLCQTRHLLAGWQRVFLNGGSGAGGDGQTLRDFSKQQQLEISRLARELASQKYRPGPYKIALIDKPNGGQRKLTIPCVRDRVVQSALAQLLQPAALAEAEDNSFAFMKGRGVKAAVQAIKRFRDEGFSHVIDADITSFFDRVPITTMLAVFQQFSGEKELVELVALWLQEADRDGDGRGLPQGSPLSPMLANLYLDELDEKFSGQGLRCVRYADDFVILCKSQHRAEKALSDVSAYLASIGLELHPQKTRILSFDKGFRYLGQLFLRSVIFPSPNKNQVVKVTATPAHNDLERPSGNEDGPPFETINVFPAPVPQEPEAGELVASSSPDFRSVYLVSRG